MIEMPRLVDLQELRDRSARLSAREPRSQPDRSGMDRLYRWPWRRGLPGRHGQLFRVIVRGGLNSALVEFGDDGARFVTSRNALRRAEVVTSPEKPS